MRINHCFENSRWDFGTYKFAEIVERTKPAWFVMENVEQIKKSTILKNVADELARDYGLTMVII